MLENLYLSTNIPLFIIDHRHQLIESAESILLPCFWRFMADSARPSSPLLYAFPSHLWASVIPLNPDLYLIAGPSFHISTSEAECMEELKSYPFSGELHQIYSLAAKNGVVSVSQLIHTSIVAASFYTDKKISADHFIIQEKFLNKEQHIPTLTSQNTIRLEEDTCHLPSTFLMNIYHCVKCGNFDAFLQLFKNSYPGLTGKFSRNPDRDQRYHFIFSTAIAQLAAIEGGIDYEKACECAEYFCQKMDSMKSLDGMEQLNAEMFHTFCDEVANTFLKSDHSPVTEKCITYIHQHLHEKIYLKSVAKFCGMSEKWISQKFASDTGTTIIHYIHIEKIKEACRLLRYTTFSIAEISALLGYSSESYFIKIFHDIINMTPVQYRT